jgi:hypothetical protein
MINKPYKSIVVSRPADQSLEAYKAWIRELAKNLDKTSEVKWTEEEWIAKWKKFWKEKPDE